MAKELGIIPEILEATPTDGLWDDARSDESQLGATYAELEWAMDWLEAHNINEAGMFTQRQREVLAIYNKWHTAGAHKLAPIPTFKRKS
jgi:NAD+ synthase